MREIRLPSWRGGDAWTGLAALLVALLLAGAALAQSFPPLTGRVVDAAGVLRPEDRAAIEAKLRAHEDRTTNQVVVATVTSLAGTTVEDYANRLYRHWRLGLAQRNNGVLLLVAPSERKVRIEVGYGLEGTLTDALSKVIITTAIAPRFRQNDFSGGLNGGVDAILNILTGDAEEWQPRVPVREDQRVVNEGVDPVIAFIVLLLLVWIISRFLRGGAPLRHSHRRRRGGWIIVPGGGWGGGWSGGGGGWSGGGGGWSGGGGGGFSGGGGSSGGGGASGSW